jgi:tRNA-specific 2-thiouridylase
MPNAAKKDSTGICFIGERPFRDFLNRYLSHKPGPMKLDNGQTVGEHIGLSFYTLGQRKGIGIGGLKSHRNADGTSEPWFVARKDIANNTLYIVQGHDHPWLLSAAWKRARPAGSRAKRLPPACCRPRRATARRTCRLHGCRRWPGSLRARFPEPQWAVTPGQSAVLYDGDICLGGGIIDGASAVNG